MDSVKRGLRAPLADRQEENPVCLCGRCAGEMYAGEVLFGWEGQRLCADCFQSAVNAWVKEAPLEVAEELSVMAETV